MDRKIKQSLSLGDCDEMPTNTYNNPGDLFLQAVTCSLSQKKEQGYPPQCVPEVKCENTVVNIKNEFAIKNEIKPVGISESDDNEFEVDNFLGPQHVSFVNNSLEINPKLRSHFENKMKVEILTNQFEIVTEDLVPDQSEGMRPDDINEDVQLTIELQNHGKKKPEGNPRSLQKHIKSTAESHNSKHFDDSSSHNCLEVDRAEIHRKSGCARSSAVKKKCSVNKQDTKKTFSCATCSQTFSLYNLYQKHRGTGVCQRRICPYCKKVFLHSTKLKFHIISHTGEKSFCCAHCMKMFGRKDYLITHIRTSHMDFPIRKTSSNSNLFYCPICNKSLASRSSLYEHKKRHSDFKQFQCAECNLSFHAKSDLRKHIQRVHSEQDKPYNCNDCLKSFSNKTALSRHLVTHSNVRAFSCNDCGQSFTRAYTVKHHKRVYHGDRNMGHGDRKVVHRDRNVVHGDRKVVHRNRKVNELDKCNSNKLHFICEYCAKLFSCRAKLEYHIRTHTAEKPFTCNFCNKSWSIKGGLEKHIKMHLPEKPYACNFCDKRCVRKGNLKDHIKSHLKNLLQ